mgnify:CR=1 FL=1
MAKRSGLIVERFSCFARRCDGGTKLSDISAISLIFLLSTLSVNQWVAGSSPAWGATKIK